MKQKHTFVYNGMLSYDYGVVLSGEDTWKRAQPDVQRISVPGRNGDLLLPGNRYKNVEITYHCGIIRDMQRNFDALIDRLAAEPGYYRLEDSYHPEFYRLASFEAAISPDVHERGRYATFEITFNCKPQRYLKSGDHWITVPDGECIYNPTSYEAMPIIRFLPGPYSGVISFGWGDIYIPVLVGSGDVEIDCELEEVTRMGKSHGPFRFSDYKAPHLLPGFNLISCSGIHKNEVRICPRWWTI